MFRIRSTVVIVSVLALAATGCSSSNEDVAALEQRIAELEATSTTAATTTTTMPTTTTSSTTTTTTEPPTTTTTVPMFDLATLDFDTLVSWMESGSIEVGFGRYSTSSCERAVDSAGKIARVFRQELVLTLGSLFEVRDGNLSLSEADARFSTLQAVMPFAVGAARGISEAPAVGGAMDYAALVDDTIYGTFLPVISFPLFVYDLETNTIDWEAFEVWGASLVTAIEELENLGQRSWADYCD